MKLYFEKDDWLFSDNEPIENKLAEINIHTGYPELSELIRLKPKERVEKLDVYFRQTFEQIIDLKLFDNYVLIGKKKRPRGITVSLKFGDLDKLQGFDNLSIFITNLAGASRKEKVIEEKFFCVKMTVVIDIEGVKPKIQDIEKRFVLIKALSFEDAYAKVEAGKDNYTAPYLNSDGRIVKWVIESLDDCYATDVINAEDFNDPEGVEVYSKLTTRKRRG